MKLIPIRNPHAIVANMFVAVKTGVALLYFFSDNKATSVLGGCAFIGGVVFLVTDSLVVRHVSRRGVWITPGNFGMLRGFLVIDLILNGVFFGLGRTLAAWPVLFTVVLFDLLALAQMAAGKTMGEEPRL